MRNQDLQLEIVQHHGICFEYKVRKQSDNRKSLFAGIILLAAALMAINQWSWGLVAILMLGLLIYIKRQETIQESLMFLPSIGIQIKTKKYSGKEEFQFISLDSLESYIIHEMMTSTEVYFYMAFVLKSSTSTAVVFKNLCPRLPILKKVYSDLWPKIENVLIDAHKKQMSEK